MTPTFVKTLIAGAAVNGGRFVKFGATDLAVLLAAGAAATEFIIGVSDYVPDGNGGAVITAIDNEVDVIRGGLAHIELGGTVVRGAPLTSDATGRAVTAAPAAGTNNRIGGFADASGVIGDVIPVFVQPSLMQG